MFLHSARQKGFLLGVGLLSLECVMFVLIRVLATGVPRYFFVIANLGLAWVAMVWCWLLVINLKNESWASWKNIVLTVLLIVFLPNTWYVLTDFIHLRATSEISEI
jgi:uncharacterized membrane protein